MIATSIPFFANPWLHGFVAGGAMITLLMSWGGIATWWERKFSARMQNRIGPNVSGPAGFFQFIIDVIKMLQKEDITPREADKAMFHIAPWLPVPLVLATMAVVPFGGHFDEAGKWVSWAVIADLDVGVLWVLALAGLMVFPLWMMGWASNNKYALLSGMRSVAQGVSYEIPLVLAAMVPVVAAGSMSMSDIVAFQAEHGWFVYRIPVIGFLAFVLFFLSSLAEGNRIPFDIPEAESELVAGVLIEYTGIKMGLVLLAEYIHTVVASALAAALFLGGGHGPGPWFLSPVYMLAKTAFIFLIIYWIRWSWVRFRSDQLMDLCWKILVPSSLFMVMGTALMVWAGWL